MKKWAAPAVVMTALLALTGLSACGGGGNESGPAEAIEPSISAITVGQPGICYEGIGPVVHVFGGTPPYRLSNALPQALKLSRDVLQDSGDAFRVDFTGGICMKDMAITIEDRMGRLARVLVNNGV